MPSFSYNVQIFCNFDCLEKWSGIREDGWLPSPLKPPGRIPGRIVLVIGLEEFLERYSLDTMEATLENEKGLDQVC